MNTIISDTSGERSAILLVEALEKSWKTYRAELKRCRQEFSNEAVHDLRVATRRIITVIQLLHSISPRPRLKEIIRMFKAQLDEFDELRDTQVILAEISESLHELPQLQGFQKQQQSLEEKILKSVRRKIKKFQTKNLTRRIHKIHEKLEKESPEGLEARILQSVDDAYSSVQQRFRLVDVARPPTIHRVRIAFKNFRYMVEIVHPLLEKYPEEHLKWMHDYQSRMGDIQDAEVFLQTLTDYAENDSFQDLEPVVRYYDGRRAETITTYARDMNHLHNFWRAAPDQPFPWEANK